MYIVGLVLAGGASRRMGRNKLRLPVQRDSDMTILGHVISTMQQVSDEVLVLVPPDDALMTGLKDEVSGVDFQSDIDFYQGPLRALADGWPTVGKRPAVAAVPSERMTQGSAPHDAVPDLIVVTAGDYPGLDASVLSACIETVGAGPRSAALPSPDGAVIHRSGVPQPLLGCYRPEVGAVLKAAAARGERRLMPAIRTLHLAAVDTADKSWPDWWTRPVHTPEEYELWLSSF